MGRLVCSRLEMTTKKTLKERVRERQQKTGERYTTALAHFRANSEEPSDITALAREAGLTCTASASARLPQARVRPALEALKALLLALGSDTGAAKMAAVLLRGEPGAPVSANGISEAVEARSFMSGVASGRRGVSANGRCAAFDTEDRTVVATVLWHGARPAFLYLAPLDAKGPWTELFALAGIGGWRSGQ